MTNRQIKKRLKQSKYELLTHSILVAKIAKKIAERIGGLDKRKAYHLGLGHDIGRIFGGKDYNHTINGYTFFMKHHDRPCARICLTHSFVIKNPYSFNGAGEASAIQVVGDLLNEIVYDEYDLLIQLADSISGKTKYVTIEERYNDLAEKHKTNEFTKEKIRKLNEIKDSFESKIHCSISDLFK